MTISRTLTSQRLVIKRLSLFIVFAFPCLAYSAQDAKDYETLFIQNWNQGLNTRDPAHKILGSPRMSNVRIDEANGQLRMRDGFVVSGVTNTLSKINFIGEFISNSGDRTMLVSDSSRIFSTSDIINFEVVKNTQNVNALHTMAQGRGRALICNGSDPCFTYDGSVHQVMDVSPNIPRGKFVAFYLDRFWVFNTTANNSALHWSALSSTNGNALSPFDPLAWPTENQLNIGIGDGAPGSGLDVYNGQLQCHKYNKAIYTIFGTDDSSFYARPTNSQVGTVSHDSIVQEDNLEYFIAKDGIYAFDGKDAARISDLIYPDVQAVVNNLSNIVSDSWDTQTQFLNKKQDIAGATVTAAGDLVVFSSQTINNYAGNPDEYILTRTSTFTHYIVISTPLLSPGNIYDGSIQSIGIYAAATNCGANPYPHTIITFRNNRTSTTHTADFSGTGGTPKSVLFSSTFSVNTQHFIDGQIVVKVEIDTAPASFAAGCEVRIGTVTAWNILFANTTGSYISEITTITAANITNWDTFRTNVNTSGGNVRFYLRSATSVVIVSSEAWSSISDGSVIPFPAHRNFIQWFATISALNYEPHIDINPKVSLVNINHNESGSADSRPVGASWKNRYCLFVTTRVAGDTSVGYVKSRITNENPNAWMTDYNINIKAVKKVFDNLYGGSSTAGAVIRLYYGTNDNGTPTNAFYETADNFMGDLFRKKTLVEYMIDSEKQTDANLTITTISDGSSVDDKTISISGSGRLLSPIRPLLYKGKYFRWRFSNNELDKGLFLNTFGVKFQRTNIDD